jgi:hypothetical protein
MFPLCGAGAGMPGRFASFGKRVFITFVPVLEKLADKWTSTYSRDLSCCL